jgi:uncharacterized membrane protein
MPLPTAPVPTASLQAQDPGLPDTDAAVARSPSALAYGTRILVFAGLVALIVLGLAWELWLAPTGSGTLAIKVLPLLLPLLGVWRYRLYTYRWLSLLIWLYVGEGLLRATSESGAAVPLAIVEWLLSMAIFVGCVLQVRSRRAYARRDAASGR